MMMLLVRLNLRYLLLMVNMTLMLTLLERLWLIKRLHVMNFLRMCGLELLLVSLLNLLLFWWIEHGKKNPNNMPQTWDALKRVMWARFVPSYYARYMLNKLQQLRQGTKSVEEYYQELQMGMLHCNIEEGEESAMARFLGGLNREI
jgi:hypothetical protein